MPVSTCQAAKRSLVTLLLNLARHYQIKLTISRDSCDKDVSKAYKKVALKAHPDKGGRDGDASKLNAARDVWEDAKKSSGPQPQPATQTNMSSSDDLEPCYSSLGRHLGVWSSCCVVPPHQETKPNHLGQQGCGQWKVEESIGCAEPEAPQGPMADIVRR